MEESKKAKTPGNQSGEKLLTILEYIIIKGEPMRLQDISRELNINKSTALRFLNTLVGRGYVSQNEETSKYCATYKIRALANRVDLHTELRKIARPYMEQLARIFGESVNMAVEDKMRSVYVEVIKGSNQTLMTVQKVGNAVPMHCTGNGKVLLLNYTEEELDHFIEVRGLPRYTEHTLTDKKSLMEELDRIRERGYAYDEQERELGARCVAFPIYGDKGKVVAGVSVTGPENRMTDEIIAPKIGRFRQIAAELSNQLGYRAFEIE